MGKVRGSEQSFTSTVMAAMINQKYSSFPEEIILMIFKNLKENRRDLWNASQVCRRFRVVALDNELWQNLPLNLNATEDLSDHRYLRYLFEAALLRNIRLLTVDPFGEVKPPLVNRPSSETKKSVLSKANSIITKFNESERLPRSFEDHFKMLRQRLNTFPASYRKLLNCNQRFWIHRNNLAKLKSSLYDDTIKLAEKSKGDSFLAGWMSILVKEHKSALTYFEHAYTHDNPFVIATIVELLRYKIWSKLEKNSTNNDQLLEKYLGFFIFEKSTYEQYKESPACQIWAAHHFLYEGKLNLANQLVDAAIANYEGALTAKALRVAGLVKFAVKDINKAEEYLSDKRADLLHSNDIDILLAAIYTKLKKKQYSDGEELFKHASPLLRKTECTPDLILKFRFGGWKLGKDYSADTVVDNAIKALICQSEENQPSTST